MQTVLPVGRMAESRNRRKILEGIPSVCFEQQFPQTPWELYWLGKKIASKNSEFCDRGKKLKQSEYHYKYTEGKGTAVKVCRIDGAEDVSDLFSSIEAPVTECVTDF